LGIFYEQHNPWFTAAGLGGGLKKSERVGEFHAGRDIGIGICMIAHFVVV